MRVIAGKFRSRKLHAPAGMEVRPTSDRMRESLFNVVAPFTPDSIWIDAFSGSGAVGIEALSRGARYVYFLEAEKKAVRAIRDNFDALGIDSDFELLQGNAVASLHSLDARGIECDICFLDPPYSAHGAYAQALRVLSDSALLKESSMVIAEHDKHFDPGPSHGRLHRHRELKQGDAVLSFYRLSALEKRDEGAGTEGAEKAAGRAT